MDKKINNSQKQKIKKKILNLIIITSIILIITLTIIHINNNTNKNFRIDQEITIETIYSQNNMNIRKSKSMASEQTIISDVPAYYDYRGCGPTAAGMIIGYWDGKGYPYLIPGDASIQNDNVKDAIANDQHFADYSLPIDYSHSLKKDKSYYGGAHQSNCLADFMRTSWYSQGNPYRWTLFSHIDDGIRGYVNYRAPYYKVTVKNHYGSGLTWDSYCQEIDNNRPVVLLVDVDGNGKSDHYVTAIGYDEDHNYACYNTWDRSIHWYDFSRISGGNSWGIYGATFCNFGSTTPQLSYSPTSHDISIMSPNEKEYTTFEIWNSGSETLSYSLSETCTWVDISPTSGSSTGEHDTISVDIDTTGLSPGFYECDISINSNGGNRVFSVSVTVGSDPGPSTSDQQQIRNDMSSAVFASNWAAQSFKPNVGQLTRVELFIGKKGNPPGDLVVSVRSSLYGYDITKIYRRSSDISSFGGWVDFDFDDINVVPGRTYFIVVRYAGGSYFHAYEWSYGYYNPYSRGSLWKSGNAGNSWNDYSQYDFCFRTFGMGSSPSNPVISSSPGSHNFGTMLGGESDSTSFQIWNSGSGTLTYSLSESCTWVDISPTSGSSTGEHDTISVDIDTTGLSPGFYECDISINSNGGNRVFSVSVTVGSDPGPSTSDQQQIRNDMSSAVFASNWAAQSFKPNVGQLTRVELFIGKKGNPPGDLVVSVRSSLYGYDITKIYRRSSDISSFGGWVDFDFDDINVVPGRTYFIVVRYAGGSYFHAYEWSYGYYNPYSRGSLWKSGNAGNSWNEYTKNDFCFKTY